MKRTLLSLALTMALLLSACSAGVTALQPGRRPRRFRPAATRRWIRPWATLGWSCCGRPARRREHLRLAPERGAVPVHGRQRRGGRDVGAVRSGTGRGREPGNAQRQLRLAALGVRRAGRGDHAFHCRRPLAGRGGAGGGRFSEPLHRHLSGRCLRRRLFQPRHPEADQRLDRAEYRRTHSKRAEGDRPRHRPGPGQRRLL